MSFCLRIATTVFLILATVIGLPLLIGKICWDLASRDDKCD